MAIQPIRLFGDPSLQQLFVLIAVRAETKVHFFCARKLARADPNIQFLGAGSAAFTCTPASSAALPRAPPAPTVRLPHAHASSGPH